MVMAMSLMLVCTKQMSKNVSTATHVDNSMHSFRQSGIDVLGYIFPFGDVTPATLVHVSQPIKHRQNPHLSVSHFHLRQKFLAILRPNRTV